MCYLELCLVVPQPARRMRVDVRSVHSLTVTWDSPSSGGLTEYRVIVEEVESNHTVPESELKSSTFTGLTAGTHYTVVVVTVSGERKSSVIQRKFYTRKFLKCYTHSIEYKMSHFATSNSLPVISRNN